LKANFMTKIHLCKCGEPCQLYGGVGGYSKCCEACNAKNAKRQREARAAAKKPKRTPLVARITEERVNHLINDVHEGFDTGDVAEWRAVAIKESMRADAQALNVIRLRDSLAALFLSEDMRALSIREIKAWLATQKQ